MSSNGMKKEKVVIQSELSCTTTSKTARSHQKEITVEQSSKEEQKKKKEKSRRKDLHDSSSDKTEKKMEIADLLVKLLVPYLKNGKITDKPSFKVLAREFTHLLIKSGVSSRKIEKLIAKFFSMQAQSVSEANAKILVRKFSLSSSSTK